MELVDLIPELIELFKKNNITLHPMNVKDSTIASKLPVVTYFDGNNTDNAIGDNVGYSEISLQLDVWSNSLSELSKICLDIDRIMKSIKFRRISYIPMSIDGIHRKSVTYQKEVREIY